MKIKEIRLKQLKDLGESLLSDYNQVLSEEEKGKLTQIRRGLDETKLEEVQRFLEPIVKRVWDFELSSGNYVIVSWNKYANTQEKRAITFATLSKKDEIVSFCDMEYGMEYEISYEAILGALEKDGATLFEDSVNDYTIGVIEGKAINSYNGATRFITPRQLVKQWGNNYPSKHNELILRTDMIKEKGSFEKPRAR